MKKLHNIDVLIIGAGVIGCSIARKLSFYNLDIAVAEKSSYVCSGQSKANGAIIHGGHNSQPDTLKAKLNVKGNRMFPEFCESLGVDFKRTGLLVIALNKKEQNILGTLHDRGVTNGVNGLKVVGRQELKRLEPNVSQKATGALIVPTAGIVDVHRLVIALAEHSAINGVRYYFDNEVKSLEPSGDFLRVTSSKNTFLARIVINCAGINSSKIASLGAKHDYKILPRKGEYYILDKKYKSLLKHPCFPVPTPNGKGVVVFPTINGNIIFGGNSIFTKDINDFSTTQEGFSEVFQKGKKIVPGIENKEIITAFAGIRSTSESHDFIIEFSDKLEGLVNLVGIDSPGLSSAPAITDYVIDLIKSRRTIPLKINQGKQKMYNIKPLFRDLDETTKEQWLKRDKRYGRIVCRCEGITEGDIVDAIHSPIPVTTVDAIKFKTWTGAGRCQGAFDLERIIKILNREANIPLTEVEKNSPGSRIILGETKVNHG